MFLHGSFLNIAGETITVKILTQGDDSETVEIGSEASGIHFSADPVSIDSTVNDLFDHLQRSEATIRLQARSFVPELFCVNALDAAVTIHRGEACIFAGYILPQTYDQDFVSVFDELEISCIDALSALQYSRFREIGSSGVDYEEVKASAGQSTFRSLIDGALDKVLPPLAALAGEEVTHLRPNSSIQSFFYSISGIGLKGKHVGNNV